jgi:electron transfer flavoprotein beta subunit
MQERVELPLPALVTVQSGINQPRYVSILGIRKVRSKTIDRLEAADLGLPDGEVGPGAAAWARRSLALPPAGARAEMLVGSLPEVCARAADIVRDRGGLR